MGSVGRRGRDASPLPDRDFRGWWAVFSRRRSKAGRSLLLATGAACGSRSSIGTAGRGLRVLSKRLEKGASPGRSQGDGIGGKLPLRTETLSMLMDGVYLRRAKMRPWYEGE